MNRSIKILAFIGVALTILAIILSLGKPVTNTIASQLKAIKTGNLEKAYYDYTTKEFQKNVSLEQFKQIIRRYTALYNNKTARFNSWKIRNGKEASVKATLKGQDGSTLHAEYKLVKEGSKWKIAAIELEDKTTIGTSASPTPTPTSQKASTLVQIGIIQKPKVIDNFYKPYLFTLKLKNKTAETIRAERFLPFDKGWNKDDVYFFSICCQKPDGNAACWTTLDGGAKCPATQGYNAAKFDPFKSIPPDAEGLVTIHFCGSAFSEILLKQGKLLPTVKSPKPLSCGISLYYHKNPSEGDKLLGKTQPFTLNFGFDIR